MRKVVSFQNGCYIQYKPEIEKKRRSSSRHLLVYKKVFRILSVLVPFETFQTNAVWLAAYNNIQLVCICLVAYTNFSPTVIFCRLQTKKYPLQSVFSKSENCGNSLRGSVIFSGEDLGFVGTS